MSQPKRNVIIIGGGAAGIAAARNLEKSLPDSHQVIVIEKREFYYHLIASLRTLSAEDIDDSIMIPYNRALKKGQIVRSTVLKVYQNEVEIEPVENWGSRIPFDYLIFATGCTWPHPIEAPLMRAEAKEHFKASRATVSQAEKIVIIGAGAVGVELAGEIKDKYPLKHVTLIHSPDNPINDVYKIHFRLKLRQQITEKGIQLLLSERVEDLAALKDAQGPTVVRTASGTEIPADLVFVTVGGKPNTSLVEDLDPNLLSDRKCVKVLPTFQVANPSLSHILAIGDITELTEMKQALKVGKHADVASDNIVHLIHGRAHKLSQYKPGQEGMLVPLGKKVGAGQLPLPGQLVIGSLLTSQIKGKNLLVDRTRGEFHY